MIDWKTTEDKNELETYAKEAHGIDLDKRRSVKKLREQIAELEASNGMREETQEQETTEEEVIGVSDEIVAIVVNDNIIDVMNDLANRIWKGQSVSLPRHERERRIKAALVDKGYSDCLDKLELPE